MSNLPLNDDVSRCLAYGLQADGLPTRRKTCPRADQCARHVTIRHDLPDGIYTVTKRRCEGYELTRFIVITK